MTDHPTTYLVDSDILLWAASFGAESPLDIGGGNWIPCASFSLAKDLFNERIDQIKVNDPDANIVLCFSCKDENHQYWRHRIFPDYKMNRENAAGKPPRTPLVLNELKRWAIDTHESLWIKGFEADDILGIYVTQEAYPNPVMVSTDKDLYTIPGLHLNPDTGSTFLSTPSDALKFHMIQTLAGDSTDNIPGCPGIGIKTASKMIAGLDDPVEMWTEVVKAFVKKELTEKDAILSARLTHILVNEDVDSALNVILWEPPTNDKEGMA